MTDRKLSMRGWRAALVVVSLFSGGAFAQTAVQLPQFDIERLDVNSAESGSILVGTGEMLPPGQMRFSLAGQYENKPLQTVDPATSIASALISDRYTIHILGALAIFDWLEVGADVPLIASQNGVPIDIMGTQLTKRGIGSPTLSVRGGLFSQRKGALADVAFQLGARAPMGTDGAFASDGKISLMPKLMIGRSLDWLRAGVELGLRWAPPSATVVNGVGNQVLVAGVLSAGKPDGLRGELSGKTYVDFTGKVGAVEVLAGARYPIGMMEVYALAGPGLGDVAGSPGTPQWRVMVGASFGNGLGLVGTPTGTELTTPVNPTVPGAMPPTAETTSGTSTAPTASFGSTAPADTSAATSSWPTSAYPTATAPATAPTAPAQPAIDPNQLSNTIQQVQQVLQGSTTGTATGGTTSTYGGYTAPTTDTTSTYGGYTAPATGTTTGSYGGYTAPAAGTTTTADPYGGSTVPATGTTPTVDPQSTGATTTP